MAPTVAGARVADVQVAFVGDLENARLERGAKTLLDQPGAVPGHGRTWMKGLTSTPLQAPAAI